MCDRLIKLNSFLAITRLSRLDYRQGKRLIVAIGAQPVRAEAAESRLIDHH